MRTNHMFAIAVYLQDRHDRSVLFGCPPSPDIDALYKGVFCLCFLHGRSTPFCVPARRVFAAPRKRLSVSDIQTAIRGIPRAARVPRKTANPENRRCEGQKNVISAMKKTVNGGKYS